MARPYQAFFNAVEAGLRRIGINAVERPYRSASYIRVCGCNYSASAYDVGGDKAVYSMYLTNNSGPDIGPFTKPFKDVSAAVTHIITTLPGKMNSRQEEKKKEERAAAMAKRCEELSKSIAGSPFRMVADGEEMTLVFNADEATLFAACDHLQDNGFVTDDPPQADVDQFARKKAVAAFTLMSSAEKRRFVLEAFKACKSDRGQLLNDMLAMPVDGVKCTLCGGLFTPHHSTDNVCPTCQ